jgi:hypothetical protein
MTGQPIAGFLDLPIGQLINLTPEQRAYLIETLLMVDDPDKGKTVPLKLNAMQREIINTITDREITLKSRRAGLTTVYVADAWVDVMTRPNTAVELFAHNDKTAKDIFEQVVMTQYKSIPEEIRPDADRSTVNSLYFKDMNSKFIVRTAGQSEQTARAAGQGRTINTLILTEFGLYRYGETLYHSLANCVPKVGGKIRIDSTPEGQNSFYRRYKAAKSEGNAYTPRFFPWWYDARLKLDVRDFNLETLTDEERELGKGNPYATDACGEDRLTLEQIAWRRAKLKDIQPLGNLTARDRFRVEFPEDDESCFLHSGRPVFMPAVLVEKGKLRKAAEGHWHVIGQDTSTGSATGHPAGIVIIDVDTTPAEQVYEWIGHEPTDIQAEKVVELQRRYPGLIVCERNFPGDSILQLLKRWEIDDVYHHSETELKETGTKVQTFKPGFPTSGVTKPRAFVELELALSAGDLILSGPRTISDLKGMQYNDKDLIEYLGSSDNDELRGLESHGELAIAMALAWHGRKTGARLPLA